MSRALVDSFVQRLAILATVATLLGGAFVADAAAQLVPVRTVPVASGDQFLLLPSSTLGMGGVHLAVDDSLGDPWSQPAKGVMIEESSFLGSPTFYSISDRGGAGRAFPIAGLFTGERWFGGVSLAMQQIDNSNGGQIWVDPFIDWVGPARRLGDVSSRNLYTSGFVGTRLGEQWSIGMAASSAHLDAMDGVDLLYARADRIEQSGGVQDLRVGLYRTSDRDRLSVSLIHNRVSMTHDVSYVDVVWNDPMSPPMAISRIEVNEDKTRTWGAEAIWERELSAPGWRIATSGTVNRKSHPKIPNYEIQNIPRDPGTTWAYEAGLGLARTRNATTFGLDIVLQPIWSETWQEADQVETTSSGKTLAIGDRTIDNDFVFMNVMLRAGLSHRIDDVEFQTGLEVRSYDYELDQTDHIAETQRDQHESWMEWTPTLGATFHFADVELRYSGRLTTGTGRPGTAARWDDAVAAPLESGDFIVAPNAPLTLQDASVLTHRIAIRVPIR